MANGKLEALLAEWRRKRLLILGLGVSNRPLARLLLEAGCRVTGCDRTDREKLDRIRPDDAAQMNILIGIGASLAGWDGLLLYIDIPKNEIQFRSRAGSITNLGAAAADAPKKMYKRFYFVDWVVLNRHKKALLPEIDVMINGQK